MEYNTIIFCWHFISIAIHYCHMVNGKRGPHHPRSEVDQSRHKIDEHFGNEIKHIKEDLGSFAGMNDKNMDKMTEEERNFYYFKIHDSDNNDLLDGLEMLHAATHHSEHIEKLAKDNDNTYNQEWNHIIDVIDDFLSYADLNLDGYLNYPEYVKAITLNNNLPPDKKEFK